jgi:L-arabinose isomerase
MLDAGLPNGAYASATQGWFKSSKKLPEFLKAYSMAGGTHHSAMVYDADIEELKAFGEMLGFDVIVIE